MESIQEPNKAFPFNNLILTPPTNSSGGNHFMRFSLNDNPLYIQTPKCKTKQVAVKTTGKRSFLDLTFTNEHEDFIQWVENLENHCQKFIYSKRDRWFDSTLEESDIENLFTSILKPIKMGKFYLLRANTPLAITTLKIYDENESLMNLEDLKEDTNMICILEFQGIKCSARGFQVDIEVKQILVLKPANIFDRCILSKKREAESIDITSKNSSSLEPSITDITQLKLIQSELDHNIEKINITPLNIQNSQICNMDFMDGLDNNIEDTENHIDIPVKEHNISDTSDSNVLSSTLFNNENTTKYITNDEKESEEIFKDKEDTIEIKSDLLEIDLNLEEVPPEDSVVIKQRNDVYYEMYKEALKKAKMAKDLALSSYLEAKRIKNLYMLDDLSDDSELEDFVGEEDEV